MAEGVIGRRRPHRGLVSVVGPAPGPRRMDGAFSPPSNVREVVSANPNRLALDCQQGPGRKHVHSVSRLTNGVIPSQYQRYLGIALPAPKSSKLSTSPRFREQACGCTHRAAR